MSFTDDADHAESRTSAPTEEVTVPSLTARLHGVPPSHEGHSGFTFELQFSEEV